MVGGKISVTGHTIYRFSDFASPLRYFFEDFFIINAYASFNALPLPHPRNKNVQKQKKEWINIHSQFHIGFSQG
jgi:hypothetical protein